MNKAGCICQIQLEQGEEECIEIYLESETGNCPYNHFVNLPDSHSLKRTYYKHTDLLTFFWRGRRLWEKDWTPDGASKAPPSKTHVEAVDMS